MSATKISEAKAASLQDGVEALAQQKMKAGGEAPVAVLHTDMLLHLCLHLLTHASIEHVRNQAAVDFSTARRVLAVLSLFAHAGSPGPETPSAPTSLGQDPPVIRLRVLQ